VNSSDTSHPASLPERLAENAVLRRLHDDPAYRLRFSVVVAASLIALVVLAFLIARTMQRRELMRVLNEQPAFHGPAPAIMFPQQVSDTPEHRELLAAGERLRYWMVRTEPGATMMSVRVTDSGRPTFTPVEGQIIATFNAGSREVTRILSVEGGEESRRVRFRYRWTELHPALGILGQAAPESGQEYEGEALFSFENGAWRVVHWNTPFEEAAKRFRELGSSAK
jgi:hypothetical protein